MPIPISHETRNSTRLRRIDRTIGRLPGSVYRRVVDLSIEAWVTDEPVPYERRRDGEYRQFHVGESWGKLWQCAWFHLTGYVPVSDAGQSIVLLIDIGGEGCVFDETGCPVQGLTTISSEFDFSLGKPGKSVVPIVSRAVGGERIDLWMDAGCNDLFGRLPTGGKIESACIAVRWEELQALCFDFEVLRELLNNVSNTSGRCAQVMQALYDASVLLASGLNEDTVAAARALLVRELGKCGGEPTLRISAVGHSHIDLAWLWPLRETIRKGARTFATALHNMDRYPDYVFGASQPQLYHWVKEYFPSLYDRVKQRIAEGRWELQGGMWVEPDANIPSGESLVRQILYGKRFFQKEFGRNVNNLWMPDVFGYSGSLPQILLKSGLRFFMTQKLSWSEVNTFPYHTFHWQGIDGTSVLVHMPPEATYNSSAAPRALAATERNYLDKSISDCCLMLFGIGDGGGGPGEEHLERLAREKNLLGLPPVTQEPASVFFDKLEQGADRYSTWTGELYLEKHQGTLTTQARNKRYNRKLEIALHDCEFTAVMALISSSHPYPSGALERIWREVLLYQFHDILPGSSITRVYDESLVRYAELACEVESLTGGHVDSWLSSEGSKEQVAINTLSWDRVEWLKVAGHWRRIAAPALGATRVDISDEAVPVAATVSGNILENESIRIGFNEAGDLVSVFDKDNGREVLRAGQMGNQLTVYVDGGDAWDFPADYDAVVAGSFSLVSSETWSDGPVAGIRQVRKFGASTMTQEIVIVSGSRRIDFKTHVDWREGDRMLRACFPIDVNSASARCEIQFGSIERPTHADTSWDAAKFEVCAHKWLDISESTYGVALLNDCKYGHRTLGGNLDINLLRSTGAPDPVADRAEHDFTYSLFPHTGDFARGGVVRAAYELNYPLRVATGDPKSTQLGRSLVTCDAESVVVESVKRAEDGGDVIVRLYEAHGSRVRASLKFASRICSASLVDLMEENPEPLEVSIDTVRVDLKPFEIVTLKIECEIGVSRS